MGSEKQAVFVRVESLLKIVCDEGVDPVAVARDYSWWRQADTRGFSQKHGFLDVTTIEIGPVKVMTAEEHIQEVHGDKWIHRMAPATENRAGAPRCDDAPGADDA